MAEEWPKSSRPEESQEVPQEPRKHYFSNTFDFLQNLKIGEVHVERKIEQYREEKMQSGDLAEWS